MNSNLTNLSLSKTIDGLKEKEFTATELTQAHIDKIKETQHLNAYILTTEELALEQAKISDEKILRGEARSFEGIPIAVKDLFCTKNIRTTACSKILHNFVPSYESTVTEKLFSNGAIMLGKTNMDEFAMGSTTATSYFGPTINPWMTEDKTELTPGGSSGGSAAVIAANLAMMALGSDTGGSVRQPASFCGIVGLKPSYGRCSRYGMIPFASSLDQAGIFTKNIYDAALSLQIISGYDDKDSTSANIPVPDFTSNIKKDLKGVKIGIPAEYNIDGLPSEIKSIWEKGADTLRSMGAEIIDISLPNTKYGVAVYYIIAPAEASSNLSKYDGVRYGYRTEKECKNLDEMYEFTRAEGFGNEVKRRILIGTYVLSSSKYDSYYQQAQKVRTLVRNDFDRAFEKVDAILAPTAPNSAFPISTNFNDPTLMYLNDVFTIPASLAGLPCLSLPAGLDKGGLPLGLQLIGKLYDESNLLNFAYNLEKGLSFDYKPY